MSRKWIIPECLQSKVTDEDVFRDWLTRKARSIRRRDNKRDLKVLSQSGTKQAIIDAIEQSAGRDYFTGEALDWASISRWNNEDAKRGGAKYRKAFWNLPTVDHDQDKAGKPVFRLCSWRMNDSKNDQSIAEFLQLAAKVQKHREGRHS